MREAVGTADTFILFWLLQHACVCVCVCVCVLVAQSCPTLCDPMDSSISDSFVRGTLQARLLEWVAINKDKG